MAGVDGFHCVTVDEFWLALIVGDLSISIKEVQSPGSVDVSSRFAMKRQQTLALQEELDAICYTLEAAMGKRV